MTTLAQRTGQNTFDDFLALVNEDEKADLLDGVIYMASPESVDDNELAGWLYRLMSEYADATDQGKCYFTRVAFRITDKRGPEPDVAFVSKDRLHLKQNGYFDGPPDIAVEIVSPDSVERDYILKRNTYEEQGVGEYWIIDPDEKSATLLRHDGEVYREAEPIKGRHMSNVLNGFYLVADWLWAEHRPSIFPTVAKMLDDLRAQD